MSLEWRERVSRQDQESQGKGLTPSRLIDLTHLEPLGHDSRGENIQFDHGSLAL